MQSASDNLDIAEDFEALAEALAESISQVDIENDCEEEAESHSAACWASIKQISDQQISDAAFENMMNDVDANSQVVTDNTDRAYRGYVCAYSSNHH
jgi:hypothetical protein